MTTTDSVDGLPDGSPMPPVHEPPPPRTDVTRKRMSIWDRTRLLLLLVLLFMIIVWAQVADNPLITFSDAFRIQTHESQWLIWLAGLEVLRQLHFLVSERSSRYHRFWSQKVFGGTDRALKRRFSDWTRFRLARLLKIVAFVALVAVVAAQILQTSPILALFEAPALIWQAAPLILQLAFAFFFVAFQFIGLFWLLSRVASTPTTRTTSRPASRTSGARTTSSRGSGRTSCSWRSRRRSRPRAGTCPAACCSGARPERARR
ncbi:hypothetical protein [Pseudonocardia sp. T1-2H]|uniref:hypothetical protein n=1 Tax=Pseudonocardia sp. T1-2H TaxID=3128899 RepID=UPI003100C606